MRSVLRFTLSTVASLSLVATFAAPQAEAAPNRRHKESFVLSGKQLSKLTDSADIFRVTGRQTPVELTVPTKDGPEVFTVIPHDDTLPSGSSSKVHKNGAVSDDPVRVDQFKEARTGGDFLRLTVSSVRDKRGRRHPRGLLRKGGVLYDLSAPTDSGSKPAVTSANSPDVDVRMAVTELDPAELSKLLAECGGGAASHLSHRGETSEVQRLIEGNVSAAARLPAPVEIKLAVAADYAFYQRFGVESSGYMASVIDSVNAIYAPLNLRFKIVNTDVFTAAGDPFGTFGFSSTILRTEFYLQSLRNTVPGFDLATPGALQLFSGRDIDGGTQVGQAQQRQLCNTHSVSVVEYVPDPVAERGFARNVTVSAHELGHLLGMVHTSNTSSVMMATTFTQNSIDSTNQATAEDYVTQLASTGPAGCIAPAGTEEPVLYSIGGTVRLGSSSGAGVAGITVTLESAGLAPVTQATGFDGTYRFTNLPSRANYTITVESANSTDRFSPAQHELYLVTNTSADFVLTPGRVRRYAVRGRLHLPGNSSKGYPDGALVSLIDRATNQVVAQYQTVKRGTFMLGGVLAGDYQLQVTNGSGCMFAPDSGTNQFTIIDRRPARQNFTVTCP